ncbi:MAG: hypothetical protein LBV31_03215 [Prevotellaceae bacterium]|nr:hypothetical protein [Prevotellaceae bacterium]
MFAPRIHSGVARNATCFYSRFDYSCRFYLLKIACYTQVPFAVFIASAEQKGKNGR